MAADGSADREQSRKLTPQPGPQTLVFTDCADHPIQSPRRQTDEQRQHNHQHSNDHESAFGKHATTRHGLTPVWCALDHHSDRLPVKAPGSQAHERVKPGTGIQLFRTRPVPRSCNPGHLTRREQRVDPAPLPVCSAGSLLCTRLAKVISHALVSSIFNAGSWTLSCSRHDLCPGTPHACA